VNFAEIARELFLAGEVTIVFPQTLFLAAKAGVVVENKKTSAEAKNNKQFLFLIEFIITFSMTFKQIVVPVALLLLVGGFVIFYLSRPKSVPQETVKATFISPTPTPVKLLTWTDEAGFSFQYPDGTSIDKHPEDTKNYANLTLTLPNKDSVSVIMSDNSFKDLDAAVGQNSALDTTLGGTPAKKFFKDGQETVVCIDNGVLVTITGKDVTQIVNTWVFVYPTQAATVNSQTTGNSDGGDVLEEE
jgi:hypothetical protein